MRDAWIWSGHVVKQCRVHPPTDGTDDLHMRIAFADTHFDVFQYGDAAVHGNLIQLVDDDQGRRTIAGRREAAAVDGGEVRGGIDDVRRPRAAPVRSRYSG